MVATLKRVPLKSIKLMPQVRQRFDAARIEALAASIRSVGLQSPPICRQVGDDIFLVDGENRIRALLHLGVAETDVLLTDDEVSDVGALERQLVCNLQRTDLNPVEKAKGIQTLMAKAPMTSEKAAARLGFSHSSITRSVSILKLPEELLALVANGEISADAAYMLSRVEDPVEQRNLASEVCGGRLSRDALARKLKASRRSDKRKADGFARCTALLGGGCSVTFAGTGLTLDSAIDWLEQLLARARKAKSQGLTLETFARTLRDQAAEGQGGTP